jgi:hypothetical protein
MRSDTRSSWVNWISVWDVPARKRSAIESYSQHDRRIELGRRNSPVTNLKGLVSTGSSGSASGMAPILTADIQLNEPCLRGLERGEGVWSWREGDGRGVVVVVRVERPVKSHAGSDRPSKRANHQPRFPKHHPNLLRQELRHHIPNLDLPHPTRFLRRFYHQLSAAPESAMYPSRILRMQPTRPYAFPTPVSVGYPWCCMM